MIDMQEVIDMARAGKFEELAARGVQITDGKLEQIEGWAKPFFGGSRAHYFIQIAADTIGKHGRYRGWKAVCGAEATTHDKAPMFGMGSWQRCKSCLRKRNAERSADATVSLHTKDMTRQESRP
ncbi:hypothetical protein [Pseudomonas sp. LS-2]|uniref:hypothetical protein n=1 Tax=Pseudomonas sp. LS-2 TaxID=2315859 RepID=UPI000E713365|nr:hypothetical protein [Pseudomonas sp. LS-2]RJX81302.1 hypothetical protein D3M70_09160 [Pseudomonas sp. LS-2]